MRATVHADNAEHAGAAGLKLVEIPELNESKATADSPVSAHTKVSHACLRPAALLRHAIMQCDIWRRACQTVDHFG